MGLAGETAHKRLTPMSMDPLTGHVKAYVGGPNYNYFQYDMPMVGRRQVGSTIKPYVYTLAMENGFSPCDQVRHVEPVSYTHLDVYKRQLLK